MRKWLVRNSVQAMLRVSALLARRPALAGASRLWMRTLARTTIATKGIGPTHSLEDLGRAWQRGFPSAKQVPITRIDSTTVYAEIHTPCPLRGSGDLAACARMMEYDHVVVERAGGNFVVLESQAQPGVTVCRVAMRRKDAPMHDLRDARETQGA